MGSLGRVGGLVAFGLLELSACQSPGSAGVDAGPPAYASLLDPPGEPRGIEITTLATAPLDDNARAAGPFRIEGAAAAQAFIRIVPLGVGFDVLDYLVDDVVDEDTGVRYVAVEPTLDAAEACTDCAVPFVAQTGHGFFGLPPSTTAVRFGVGAFSRASHTRAYRAIFHVPDAVRVERVRALPGVVPELDVRLFIDGGSPFATPLPEDVVLLGGALSTLREAYAAAGVRVRITRIESDGHHGPAVTRLGPLGAADLESLYARALATVGDGPLPTSTAGPYSIVALVGCLESPGGAQGMVGYTAHAPGGPHPAPTADLIYVRTGPCEDSLDPPRAWSSPVRLGNTIGHELGHRLGLFHSDSPLGKPVADLPLDEDLMASLAWQSDHPRRLGAKQVTVILRHPFLWR